MNDIADEAATVREPEADTRTAPEGVEDDIDFVPTTEFGRRLLELRRRAIASGQPLLTREELERELAERRGGLYIRHNQ